MTDAERVLAVLIHDVRTPLGVAHGYLRLIRTDKLPAPADRDRALAGTQEALAKISRLCQEAGGFLDDAPTGSGRAPTTQVAQRVAALLGERGLGMADHTELHGDVIVGTSLDRTADAIVTLLAVRGRTPGAVTVVEEMETELRFACGPASDASGRVLDGVERPFDPWHAAQGLGVPLAYRLITALGGRVWTAGDNGLALALSRPMESRKE